MCCLVKLERVGMRRKSGWMSGCLKSRNRCTDARTTRRGEKSLIGCLDDASFHAIEKLEY